MDLVKQILLHSIPRNAKMSFTTLVTSDHLFAHLDDPGWVVLDCRFSLADAEHGRREYLKAHVPGALYAHLEEDLSGPIVQGVTSRHPLPEVADFERTLGAWGIDERVQVVVYDDMGGAIAARPWWMLGWVGHDAVALLDGGWQRWCGEGRPITAEAAARPTRVFTASPRPERLVPAAQVLGRLGDASAPLLDARAGERYRGEVEPLDPVAGHIPGAMCAPFEENLSADGTFSSRVELRRRFRALLGEQPPEHSVSYCGSGVTACHNLLAMEHAGLAGGRLYAGSWSHWVTDPDRPVERG